jgi:hypothetical protein
MRIVATVFVGLIAYWLGWYYTTGLGYRIWPGSEWFGGVFGFVVGAPLCATIAVRITWKISGRKKRATHL